MPIPNALITIRANTIMDIIAPLCFFCFCLTAELQRGHTVAFSLIVSPHFGQVVNPIPISSFLLIRQSTRFAGKFDVLCQQKLTLIFIFVGITIFSFLCISLGLLSIKNYHCKNLLFLNFGSCSIKAFISSSFTSTSTKITISYQSSSLKLFNPPSSLQI